MISWAVEPSFSSTVTSISDPLCTVLAANLAGKKETFYHERGEKRDNINSNRFKITFFSSDEIIYCKFPTAKNSRPSILLKNQ